MEGLEYGAEVYLEKPFYKEELLFRIRKLLLDQRKILQRVSQSGRSQPDRSGTRDAGTRSREHCCFFVIEEPVCGKGPRRDRKNLQEEAYSVDQMCKHLS